MAFNYQYLSRVYSEIKKSLTDFANRNGGRIRDFPWDSAYMQVNMGGGRC